MIFARIRVVAELAALVAFGAVAVAVMQGAYKLSRAAEAAGTWSARRIQLKLGQDVTV
jgi:hypothetical protein